jgi:hypothetical protein
MSIATLRYKRLARLSVAQRYLLALPDAEKPDLPPAPRCLSTLLGPTQVVNGTRRRPDTQNRLEYLRLDIRGTQPRILPEPGTRSRTRTQQVESGIAEFRSWRGRHFLSDVAGLPMYNQSSNAPKGASVE